MVDHVRDYSAIAEASLIAREGVVKSDLTLLGQGIKASYAAQLNEGMPSLPETSGCLGRKYSGGGFGGYALYLFANRDFRDSFVSSTSSARPIEPYSNWQ
jgi:mevalonate kinase